MQLVGDEIYVYQTDAWKMNNMKWVNIYLHWGGGVAGDPHKKNSAASKTVKTYYLNITYK